MIIPAVAVPASVGQPADPPLEDPRRLPASGLDGGQALEHGAEIPLQETEVFAVLKAEIQPGLDLIPRPREAAGGLE